MQETWVQSLGQEALLEKEMATHSSILTGIIPWTEEPGGLQFIGSQRVREDWVHTQQCSPHLLKKEKVNHLKFRKHVSKSNKIMFRRKSRIKTSESVALKVQEQWREWKQNVKPGAMGQGTCRLYWTEGQSPLWAQLLFLIADYKTFFDLSLLRHYIDIVQILFLSQAVPFWHSLRNNQPVHRQCSYLTLVHAFMIPVTLPSGSGLGVCNKAIILRKPWKIIINTVYWYMLFFQVLFLWNF